MPQETQNTVHDSIWDKYKKLTTSHNYVNVKKME